MSQNTHGCITIDICIPTIAIAVVGTVSSERHGWIYVNPDKGGLPVQGHGRASMEFLDE